ncbi:MAG: sigma-70 family RNA polymerase sigma factor [Acidimicrobiia bacterium]|nr:sigma-70 family RNA polymerase sigma factor [Acidimicrobiia bacterium]
MSTAGQPSADSRSHQITRLLEDWQSGNKEALDQLTPLVYEELRRLANSYFSRERPDHTLQPTALIHEAYLRLMDQQTPEFRNRAHFFGVAAQLMRQILVDHARSHRAHKRGGLSQRVPLEETVSFSLRRSEELIALDKALAELEQFDARKCRVIEFRYFGGLTSEEISQALGISTATVGRELRLAQAWLHRAMSQSDGQ